jgi:NADPH2:quinone reductase
MKAICVRPDRALEVRDIATPDVPAPGHVLVDMDASAINHGDKAFLKLPSMAGRTLAAGQHDVWGASGAGTVVALGAGVPAHYAGKQVAIYRSLARSDAGIGLWCERVQAPYTTCLVLPDHVRARDYCGSLVNVMTAYAFLEQIVEDGHKGVIVTAGNSSTGIALAALARKRQVPAIFLVRSNVARDTLRGMGVEHVIVSNEDERGTDTLAALAAELGTTAIFDGVGGDLVGKIAPFLPMNSTIYCYGFLGEGAAIAVTPVLLMMKNLTLRRFSNFDSATVKQPEKLVAALSALEGLIDDPMFTTRLGREFGYDAIGEAMTYQSPEAAKAVLLSRVAD